MIEWGTALAIISWAAGVWMGTLWGEHTLEATKITHKREMDEIFEEVTRLRTQVAGLIGTKK